MQNSRVHPFPTLVQKCNSTGATTYTSTSSSRRRLFDSDLYDESLNAGADVLAMTVGTVAFQSAIPPVVRIVEEDYEPTDEVRSCATVLDLWLFVYYTEANK